MIFNKKLEERHPLITEAITELFDAAFKNQTHPQDLLLILEHGFYEKKYDGVVFNKGMKFSPFVIGPEKIGYALQTNFEFYHWYRSSHIIDENEFSKKKTEPEIQELEKITIHLEKMIYLKFWESDMILKELYQLAQLAMGRPYDWYLNIPTHSREGSKQELIREEIRDKLESVCPKFYSLLKENYKSQLRNAIAHSQYGFMGRTIQYLNFSKDKDAYSPISHLTFEDWGNYFHDTLLLYNALISGLNKYRDYYHQKTLDNKNTIEIRITKKDNSQQLKELGVRKGFKAWAWRENLDVSDF